MPPYTHAIKITRLLAVRNQHTLGNIMEEEGTLSSSCSNDVYHLAPVKCAVQSTIFCTNTHTVFVFRCMFFYRSPCVCHVALVDEHHDEAVTLAGKIILNLIDEVESKVCRSTGSSPQSCGSTAVRTPPSTSVLHSIDWEKPKHNVSRLNRFVV